MSKVALFFCLSAMILISGCRKSSPPATPAPAAEQTAPVPADKSVAGDAKPKPLISNSLKETIAKRSSWNPILANFYGKEMPDFTVKDIAGRTHNLHGYRGKNVLVVMWATWCMPCMEEVPNLKALREIMSEDKLAILAISNEPADSVKTTAKREEMSYTVISYRDILPAPFSSIRGYPSAFFIRPDGTLKLVAEGGLSLGEMKSVILAE